MPVASPSAHELAWRLLGVGQAPTVRRTADVAGVPAGAASVFVDGGFEDGDDPTAVLSAVCERVAPGATVAIVAGAARNLRLVDAAVRDGLVGSPKRQHTRATLAAAIEAAGLDLAWLAVARDNQLPWVPLPLYAPIDVPGALVVHRACTAEVVEELTAEAFVALARRPHANPPQCSIVIPTAGERGLLARLLTALVTDPPGATAEIVIVDDAPIGCETVAEALASLPATRDPAVAVRVVSGPRTGFAGAANAGLRAATGATVVLFHDDAVPHAGAIDELLAQLDATGAAVAGPRLLDDRGACAGAGLAIGPDLLPYALYRQHPADAAEVTRPQTVTAVPAACWAATRVDLIGAGGFDEGLAMFADADLCLRLLARQRAILYAPDAVVTHRGHGTPGDRDHLTSAAYFRSKWAGRLHPDDAARAVPDGIDLPTLRARSWYQPRPGRTPVPHGCPPPVLWTSLLFDRGGYANEARTYLDALRADGVPAFANPYRWPPPRVFLGDGRDEHLDLLATAELPRSFVHVCHLPAQAVARHPAALANVARTMWETDRLPDDRAAAVAPMDAIWVPKAQNVDLFAAAGIPRDRLHIVPAAIDDRRYRTLGPAWRIDGARGFVFLSLFVWSRRKGWDALVRAYVEEFGADEDVTLVLAVSPRPASDLATAHAELADFVRHRLGRSLAGCPPIVWLPLENASPRQVAALYRAADAYVMPTRGEGAALPISEAMASALPAIVTRDCVAYVDDATALLVDYEWCDIAEGDDGELAAFHGHRWAEPDHRQLREAMRRVTDERDVAATVGAAGRDHVLATLSMPVVAAQVRARLEALVAP